MQFYIKYMYLYKKINIPHFKLFSYFIFYASLSLSIFSRCDLFCLCIFNLKQFLFVVKCIFYYLYQNLFTVSPERINKKVLLIAGHICSQKYKSRV